MKEQRLWGLSSGDSRHPGPAFSPAYPQKGPRPPILSPSTVTVPGEHRTASSAPLTRQERGTRCHTIPPLVPLFARQRTSSGEPWGRLPHRGRGEASLGVNEAPEMFCHLSVGSHSRCQSARSPQRAKH